MKEENNNLNSQSEEQIEKTSIINITDDGNSNENDNINKEQVVNTNPISEVKSNIESTSNVSQIKDDVIQSMNTTNVNISDQSNDIPNNLVNPETSDFDDIRNGNKVNKPLIIGVIILLIIALVAGVYFLYLTPQRIFNKTIDKISAYSNKTISSVTEVVNDNFKTILGKFSSELSLTQDKDKMSINVNGDIGYDKDNNSIYVSLNGKNFSEEQYYFNILMDKTNKIYMSFDKDFNDSVFIDTNESNETFNINLSSLEKANELSKNMIYISDKVLESLKKNYDTSKFKKTLEIKKINNKKVLTLKLIDNINQKESMEIGNKMLDDFIKDDKFIESLISVMNSSADKDTIKKLLESLKEDTSDADENVNVDLILNYSMDGKLVYAQIGDDEYKLTIKNDGKMYYITIEDDSNLSKVKTDIKYNLKDGSLTIDSDELNITYNGKIDKVSNKEYKYNLNIKIKTKETEINIKTDMSIKYDDKLNTIDVSKSKDINDLSPKEMQKFMEQTATIFPTILGMINQSSNNTFLTEIKSIYSSARKQFTLDDLNNSVKGDVTYSNIKGCSGKTLDVDFKEVAYSITLDKEGNVKAFNVYSGVYVFEETSIKDISDITLDKIDYEYDYAITKCTK